MKKRIFSLMLVLSLFLGLVPLAGATETAYPRFSTGMDSAAYIDDSGSLWLLGGGNDYPTRITEGKTCTVQAYPGEPAMLVRTDGTLLFFSEGFSDEGEELMEGVRKAEIDYIGDCGYILTMDGILWGWGTNYNGTLSPGGVSLGESTVELVPLLDQVANFSVMTSTVLALREDGTLWSWGSEIFGMLGTGREGDSGGEEWLDIYRETPMQLLDGVTDMAMGIGVTLAVREDGTLWSCGICSELIDPQQYDKVDQFGQSYSSRPVPVMEDVRAVASGDSTYYILKTDDTLWTCGSNTFGEAGVGSRDSVPAPTQIMAEVDEVAAGDYFAFARKKDGTLWSWGLNHMGQLGNGGQGDSWDEGSNPCQTFPAQLFTIPPNAAADLAYPSTQTVLVDGAPVEFPCYARKDENGNDTNYIKLRDLALILNGTAAQFGVNWDGGISLTPGERYTPNGSELSTPYSGVQYYTPGGDGVRVNGQAVAMDSLVITSATGGGYTYFQLRDLGSALGFKVEWSAETGISISTR